MTRHSHVEFSALVNSEQADAFRAALNGLPESERAEIMRQAANLMDNLQAIRQQPSGMGIAGALELLAKLGIWYIDNPHLIHVRRWDDDDLKPETKR